MNFDFMGKKNMAKQIDAIGIGCRRCASSFLHYCLNQHPEVIKPDRGIHFFSEFADRGLDWYIDSLPKKNDDKTLLEFSISYTYPEYAHTAAHLIKEMFPDVKLFVTVRNPIERAFSDYLRSIKNLEISHNYSFEQAIEIYPAFLDRGRYSLILNPYFDLFPSERIHVLIYEDLLESTEKFLNPFFHFLGVTENLVLVDARTKKKKRGELRWPLLQSTLLGAKKILDQSAEKFHCLELWTKTKKRFLSSYLAIRSANTLEITMADSTRRYLYSFYKSDIDFIKEKTGRNLNGWS